jgi:ABC-type Fe3+/spermidine/putrescine transport system ATPase subunit
MELTVELPAGMSAGTEADLAVRPENIRLHETSAGATLPAKIAELTFLGNTNEYIVVAGTQRLRVQTHPSQVFNAGDDVRVEFDSTQCTVFARK